MALMYVKREGAGLTLGEVLELGSSENVRGLQRMDLLAELAEDATVFECDLPDCGRRFANEELLEAHARLAHPTDEPESKAVKPRIRRKRRVEKAEEATVQ